MSTFVLEWGGEACTRCMTARAPDTDRVSMDGRCKHGLVDGVGQVLLVERLEVAKRGARAKLQVDGRSG